MTSSESTFESMFRKRFGRSPTPEELRVIIDQSVTSYNQSGGITAHTVNVGPQQREMTHGLKSQILSQIPRTSPIAVVAVMGDGEAMQLATEIHAFLKSNGYPLTENGISQALYTTPQKGIVWDATTSTFIIGANLP